MEKKEIEKAKRSMGEIEFYRYFYYDSNDDDFMKEYLPQFRESEKLLFMIYNSIKEKKDYEITLFEGAIMIENKKTKNSYKINIEF